MVGVEVEGVRLHGAGFRDYHEPHEIEFGFGRLVSRVGCLDAASSGIFDWQLNKSPSATVGCLLGVR